ncbi:MAG: DUF1801 domain-containing protein [Acidimicrobiia bacterium]|nr:DUF1801 domain-containing protein [Acidimicrobiia bacterium]
MTGATIGTFAELLDLAEEAMRPIAERLRTLVFEIDPESVEVVRLGDRAATYGVGPKKMSEGYAYVLPYSNWVNLGFYRGADLPDPDGLLEGTGARMRHVKIRSIADADTPAIRTLIRAAITERESAVGRKRE